MREGGVAIKVLTGRSGAGSLGYRDKLKPDQEPYLMATSRHCPMDVKGQILAFADTRAVHGTQGAKRAVRARYETVDPATGLHASGQPGTHVVDHWPSGGAYKRPVRDGEQPTHLRIAPEEITSVKQSEATHSIYAASKELVDPDDPEQIVTFFEAVRAERAEHYPGLQESLWIERNGESGLVHVHVSSNATIYRDFELNGRHYRAGQKMAKDLTRVDAVRKSFETYLDEHPEYGMKQSLARVGTKKYEQAQVRDGEKSYWDRVRGQQSRNDAMRQMIDESLSHGATDRAGFIAEMTSRGVEVKETGLRRGVPTAKHDYVFVPPGAKQGVKGGTLGADYSYAAVGEHLDAVTKGMASRRGRQPEAVPATEPTLDEIQGEINMLTSTLDRQSEREREERERDRRWEEQKLQQKREIEERWAQQKRELDQQVNEQRQRLEDSAERRVSAYGSTSGQESTTSTEQKTQRTTTKPTPPRPVQTPAAQKQPMTPLSIDTFARQWRDSVPTDLEGRRALERDAARVTRELDRDRLDANQEILGARLHGEMKRRATQADMRKLMREGITKIESADTGSETDARRITARRAAVERMSAGRADGDYTAGVADGAKIAQNDPVSFTPMTEQERTRARKKYSLTYEHEQRPQQKQKDDGYSFGL